MDNVSSPRWLSELQVVEDSVHEEEVTWQTMRSLEEFNAFSFRTSAGSYPTSSSMAAAARSLDPNYTKNVASVGSGNSAAAVACSSSRPTQIICFGMSGENGRLKMEGKASAADFENGRKKIRNSGAASSDLEERASTERIRRERLNQKFIALSALLPRLQRLDKASILGDAAEYMKQLEEQVKTLEERITKERMDAMPGGSFNSDFGYRFPAEIEAKVSNKHVLVRVHCENRKGILEKILQQMGKLHLSAVNSSAMPFGDHAMDITIIAQVEDEFCMTEEDIVTKFRQTLQSI